MGNVKKTPLLALLCIILSVLTLIAMMPGTAYAQDDAEGNAPQAGQNETAGSPASRTWDYSKSKTATELAVDSSGNLTSEITLSLPSKEEKLDSDIVFVIPFKRSQVFQVIAHSVIGLFEMLEQRSPQLAQIADNSRFFAGIESVERIGTFFPETRFQCRFSYSNQVGYNSHYLFCINGQGYPPLSLVFSICLSMTVIISLSRLSPIPLILLRSARKLS